MAFGIGSNGNILQDFTNSVNEAFGGAKNSGIKDKGRELALSQPELFGVEQFEAKQWLGNTQRARDGWLRYGFAILNATGGTFQKTSVAGTFYLDVPPQSIQQKEIFSTHVQATRKGVIVESEGVVFKDIVLTGTTGVFPGERGGSNTPSPNFTRPLDPPTPPSGVAADTGRSTRSGINQLSGYEEFIRLRQFFLDYASQKVQNAGNVFFAFINEKDQQHLVVEPLEFTMERSSRSPLNYNYRIVLKAIAPLASLFSANEEKNATNILDQIGNLSANVSATLAATTSVINATTNLIVGITQALDNIFLTPMRQLNLALTALANGSSRVLSLPGTLFGNAQRVDKNRLAIAERLGNTSTVATKSSGSKAKAAEVNTEGAVTDTSSVDSTTEDLNLLNEDGSLKQDLTPQEFSAVKEIENQIAADILIPLPRSFVEALKQNTINIINDLADSAGLGSDSYNEILGRTVTQPPAPLTVPSDEQFVLLGALQKVVSELNKILSNNAFFQGDAEQIYTTARETYGLIAAIKQPNSAREIIIEKGDTLERIALREYGDALRWVDLVILNNLRAPYIAQGQNLLNGVKRPGDKILVGNT